MFKKQIKPSIFFGLSFFISFFLLRIDLNCMIYSCIQGEVFEISSAAPIVDATVKLIRYNPDLKMFSSSKTINTDKSGKFIFNKIAPGYYLVKVEKDGFVSTVPDYQLKVLYGVEIQNLEKAFPVIKIDKEGSIKYLKIMLKPGRTIKGKISGITKKGYFGRLKISVNLSRKTDEAEQIFNKDDEFGIFKPYIYADGLYTFEGLEPRNDYKLVFEAEGFPIQRFYNIDVLTKDTAIIDCIFDSTDKTGIEGKVRINGKIPESFSISLDYHSGGDEIPYYYYNYKNISSDNPDGEFSIYMITPGKYYIFAHAFGENNQEYEREIFVEVIKNETKTIDFNF
jgi:hypothetical protein